MTGLGPPPIGTPSAARVVGIDVTRAVALVGVVVMNYHGYLNGSRAAEASNWAGRLFDPWEGVLSTRFAATFVVVAGIGVTLLTRRSVASADADAIRADRWRLRRRGLLLLAVGHVFDWVWPGTILPFYGLYFIIASFLFTWRLRRLVAAAVLAALGAAALQMWNEQRLLDGDGELWFLQRAVDGGGALRSPRNLVADLLVRGTHPVMPWLAFMIAGMLLGRLLTELGGLRRRLIVAGLGAVAVGYALSTATRMLTAGSEGRVADHLRHLTRTDPFARGLLYTLTALGSSVAAVVLVCAVAERWPTATPVDVLRRAGQMSLTLYLAHALVFNVAVDWLHWVGGTGLDTALLLSAVFWLFGVTLAAWWQRLFGQGPAERIYRLFGG